MRRVQYLLSLLVLVALAVSGCSSANNPDKTINAFCTAFQKGDFSRAAQYVSASTLDYEGITADQLAEQWSTYTRENGIKYESFELSPVTDWTCPYDSSIAMKRVDVTWRASNGQGQSGVTTDHLLLTQESGAWKVNASQSYFTRRFSDLTFDTRVGGNLVIEDSRIDYMHEGVQVRFTVANKANAPIGFKQLQGVLKTSDGTWSADFWLKVNLNPNDTFPVQLSFPKATGTPKAFSLRGIEWVNAAGFRVNAFSPDSVNWTYPEDVDPIKTPN